MSWVYVTVTVALTVYGQLVVKWQVSRHGHLPASLVGKTSYFGHLLLNLWVLSALVGAFVAAVSWMAAISRLPLSEAYPFVGLSFVFVLLLSAVFFGEALTVPKIVGVSLIVGGIAIASVL